MALVTSEEIVGLDPDFGAVALLVSGDSLAQDHSSAGVILTPHGGAEISTAQSKWGGSSIGSGYLTASPPVSLTTADFTIELWAYALSYGGYQSLVSTRPNANSDPAQWVFGFDPAGSLYLWAAGFIAQTASAAVPINTWTHLAAVRLAGSTTLYIDGAVAATGTDSHNYVSAYLSIRANGNGDEPFGGYVDDVRITAGVARYTGAFTPPAAEFPWLAPPVLGFHGFTSLLGKLACAPAEAMDAAGARAFSREAPNGHMNVNLQMAIGTGRISGTVKISPASPAHRKVRCFHERSGMLIAETWSDATTGAYAFDYLAMDQRFTLVSFDHTETYRAVIADRVLPEALV